MQKYNPSSICWGSVYQIFTCGYVLTSLYLIRDRTKILYRLEYHEVEKFHNKTYCPIIRWILHAVNKTNTTGKANDRRARSAQKNEKKCKKLENGRKIRKTIKTRNSVLMELGDDRHPSSLYYVVLVVSLMNCLLPEQTK